MGIRSSISCILQYILFQTNMKMLISMIYQLREIPDFPNTYFYKNHPISKITLVGFVNSIIQHETFSIANI